MQEPKPDATPNRGVPRLVIAVSGTSGAGKTTLATKVVELLKDAVLLRFDDYIRLGNDPAVVTAWLQTGARPDDLKIPQMARDLRALIAGQPVHLPGDLGVVEPAGFIVLEEPFGRSRAELAPVIGLAVHLEVPADIALARRVTRAIDSPATAGPEQRLEEIRYDLRTYLIAGREAYKSAERAARESADLVLDGMSPVDELATEVVAAAHRHRG